MIYQHKNSIGHNFFEMIRYNNFNFEMHMHRHFELIYVRKGELLVDLFFFNEVVKQGECAFIPSNYLHSYKSLTETIVDVCVFSSDFVPKFNNEISKKNIASTKFICEKNILDFAKKVLFVTNNIPNEYTCKGVLYAICGQILSLLTFKKQVERKDVLFNNIIEYIAKNFTKDISLKSMSKELGYEVHYLSKNFRKIIPIHFNKYLNLFRVDRAIELLQNTNKSVSDIAFESGFQSIRTFNRAFLEVVKCAPNEYMIKST